MINLKRVKVLIKKDLLGIINDEAILFSLCILPLIFSLILPLLILLMGSSNVFISSVGGLNEFIENVDISSFPSDIKAGSEPLYAILMYFFIPLFLLIPVMIATVIASSSFVGERENKTLEGLLYTPLTNRELVLGKILASAVPAMIATLISVIIYGVLIDTVGLGIFGRAIFPNLNWLVVVLLLNPLIVFLAIALIISVSQHVKTSKFAQSVAMILILPIIGGLISQASGALLLGTRAMLLISLLLLIIDIIAFLFISKHFNREKYILNN
ncbi:ABC transporter permease [Loigolactobacillus rennini]|uniref:ABC transporter membrane-spanning subunit n=1 Tax=Loigolactobacillus rennini DSM 20253 TaxID=1423796 RepID=A0A0R2D3P4_9LACO|nr:ABC transporter permease subunit [Loigolactobacillus rennini]KRM98735.1 ABC transporter membrane-spanning subunit [Loigolactobacillus rennini DSM 20253]